MMKIVIVVVVQEARAFDLQGVLFPISCLTVMLERYCAGC